MFSCEYCEIFQERIFHKTPRLLLLVFTTTFRDYYREHLSVIFFTLIHPSKRPREAAVYRCFSKKVFLKIFANFVGNTCVGVPS